MTAPALTVVSVLVLGITLTWTFFSMRSVMNDTGSRWWVPAYTALGAAGFLAGAWSYNALS